MWPNICCLHHFILCSHKNVTQFRLLLIFCTRSCICTGNVHCKTDPFFVIITPRPAGQSQLYSDSSYWQQSPHSSEALVITLFFPNSPSLFLSLMVCFTPALSSPPPCLKCTYSWCFLFFPLRSLLCSTSLKHAPLSGFRGPLAMA